MIYRELLDALNELTEEQLNMSVTVLFSGHTFCEATDTMLSDEIDKEAVDIVGENHPIIIIADYKLLFMRY